MRYVVGRLGQGLVVIWAAFTITFVILYLLPADPVEIMLNQGGDTVGIDPEAKARLRAEYGLDQSVLMQYLQALGHAVRGDFGSSIVLGRPVVEVVLEALPQTIMLAGLAGLIAAAMGLTIALAATASKGRWLHTILVNLPALSISAPSFWVGMLLMQLLSFRLGWFPALGNEGWRSMVLPALTLALPTAAVTAQVLYNNLTEALRQAFVEVLRAKGLSERAILLRHALRLAALPALTLVGMNIAAMLAGAIVIETVFSRSGLGRLTEGAVTAQDIPLVQGIVVISAVVFVAANLIVDLLYPLLDPRVSYKARQG